MASRRLLESRLMRRKLCHSSTTTESMPASVNPAAPPEALTAAEYFASSFAILPWRSLAVYLSPWAVASSA